MPTTTPDNIWFTDDTTPSSLDTVTATLASSVQTALNNRSWRNYTWADTGERAAQTGMTNGSLGRQLDDGTLWQYDGTNWVRLFVESNSYETLTALNTVTGYNGQKATVWGDPNPANNGDYEWNGTAWAATVNYMQRYSETQQNIANATTTMAVLNDSTISEGNQIEATGLGGITVLSDGIYRCLGSLSYYPLTGSTTINYMQAYLAINGSAFVMGGAGTTSSLAEGGRASVEQTVELQAGDMITLLARHSVSPATSRPISSSSVHKSILIVEKR